jgi:hypothetical protein
MPMYAHLSFTNKDFIYLSIYLSIYIFSQTVLRPLQPWGSLHQSAEALYVSSCGIRQFERIYDACRNLHTKHWSSKSPYPYRLSTKCSSNCWQTAIKIIFRDRLTSKGNNQLNNSSRQSQLYLKALTNTA